MRMDAAESKRFAYVTLWTGSMARSVEYWASLPGQVRDQVERAGWAAQNNLLLKL